MKFNTKLLNIIQRVRWAHFPFALSTGGLALVLGDVTHRFHGLNTIGTIVFLATIVIFLLFMTAAIIQFNTVKGSFKESYQNQSEILFFPTVLLTISTIILGISRYALPHTGDWIIIALRVLFWIYGAIALLQCTLSYAFLFTLQPGLQLHLHSMTPIWLLPSLPLSLANSIAASIAPLQPSTHALPIAIAGLLFQGIGFSIFLFEGSLYILRLSVHGMPDYDARPAMFLAVGPPAFAAFNLVSLGLNVDKYIDDLKGPLSNPYLSKMLAVNATCFGIFIYGIALWLFLLAFLANITAIIRKKEKFHIAWWSFIFPNVGFTNATNLIGQALDSQAISWVVVGFTLILVIVYLILLILLIRLFYYVAIGKEDDVISVDKILNHKSRDEEGTSI